MNKSEQNKFEQLASLFHHELSDGINAENCQQEIGNIEDKDFLAVKRIFDAKDLVDQASKVSSPEVAWYNVHSRISRRHPLRNIVYWKYAAAVLAVALTIGLFTGKNIRSCFSDPEQFISIVSPSGKIKNLTLADGTEVWLNSGSTLKISNRFDKTNRHIMVDGEAFLKVVKDGKNPFAVTLGNSKVIVHGTTFNVKAYSTDDKYELVLVEGSVEYVNSQKNIFIKPGERITETKASGDLLVDHVDIEKCISWISEKAYFDSKTLLELVTLLEKWYNVDFEFANDTTKSYKFTGVINREQTLDYTLKMIEMTNKVKFLKKGGKMLITN